VDAFAVRSPGKSTANRQDSSTATVRAADGRPERATPATLSCPSPLTFGGQAVRTIDAATSCRRRSDSLPTSAKPVVLHCLAATHPWDSLWYRRARLRPSCQSGHKPGYSGTLVPRGHVMKWNFLASMNIHRNRTIAAGLHR